MVPNQNTPDLTRTSSNSKRNLKKPLIRYDDYDVLGMWSCMTHLGVDANPEVVSAGALEVEPDGL